MLFLVTNSNSKLLKLIICTLKNIIKPALNKMHKSVSNVILQ